MNVSLSISQRADGEHRLTVVARPRKAALLGEYVLMESVRLEDLPPDPDALQVLSSAYRSIAALVQERHLTAVRDL
jgi:hypothetical protein